LPYFISTYPFVAVDFLQLGAWAFWVLLPVSGLLAACWGVMLGFPVLRLRGDYLAIVTLAFGEIIRLVIINWQDLTGGPNGISGIPRPTFFGVPLTPGENGFAALIGVPFSPTHRLVFLFYLILALALLTNWVTIRLRRLPSPAGRSASTSPRQSFQPSPSARCSAVSPARSSQPARVSSVRNPSPSRNRRWCSPSSCSAEWARSSAWRSPRSQ
jgi:hypothetical protein